MRTGFAGWSALALAAVLFGATAKAQVTLQTTPAPSVAADNEPWYTGGAPISYGGNVYYPAGPITHFSANEMVPTGTFGNVAIYVRTTQEPGSVIYVPLAGGLMKPYERRRSGDLAGTVGSSAPSFPVVLPAEEAGQPVTLQAAAPPTGTPVRGFAVAAASAPAPPAPVASVPVEAAPEVGTSGRMAVQPAVARTRVQTVQRPVGINSVFVQFQGARWYAAGPAVEFSADRFTQVGEHGGFPVYQQKGQAGVIYLSLLRDGAGLIAPYRTR